MRLGEGTGRYMRPRKWTWTVKRKVALECLIQAQGSVHFASIISKDHSMFVPEVYIRHLKHDPEHRVFREEFRRRTGELLNALEVNTAYVLETLLDLSRPGMPPTARLGAARALGDYLGMWAPRQIEMSVSMIARLEEMGINAEDVIAEAQRIIRDASRGVGY